MVWVVVGKMQGSRTYYKSMIQESSDVKKYLLVKNTEMVEEIASCFGVLLPSLLIREL